MIRLRFCTLCILVVGSGAGVGHAEDVEPFRLREAVGAPAWLDLGLTHRTRVEELNNDFRAGSDADATALVVRTILLAEAGSEVLRLRLEVEDSRAYATDATPLNTTSVDALELLQANLGMTRRGLIASGDQIDLRLGRITLDVGSRRLVARNRYRNTINGFTGLDGQWTNEAKTVARVFAVMPVTRLPSDADAIRDNAIELDEENTHALLWGAFFAGRVWADSTAIELYAVGLHERDGEVATRNRQLISPGARAYRNPASGQLDFEAEAVLQLGTSRASTAADDTASLDHRAFFMHAETGWTARQPWSPRLVAQYDYASGDKNPNDEKTQRFDTLFGARRFEFGPTGIYGPFLRSNLSTPGMRLELTPHATVDAVAAYRLYWLASKRDAWPTAGLQDPAGTSGSFLGQQAEVRVRWHVFPQNLSLEMGAAHLIPGGFAIDAPDGDDAPSTYAYAQLTGTI